MNHQLLHHTEKALLACDDAYHVAARQRNTPVSIQKLQRSIAEAITQLTQAQAHIETSSATEEGSPLDTSSAAIAAIRSLITLLGQEISTLSILHSSDRAPSPTRIRNTIQSAEVAIRYLKSLQALAVDLRER